LSLLLDQYTVYTYTAFCQQASDCGKKKPFRMLLTFGTIFLEL